MARLFVVSILAAVVATLLVIATAAFANAETPDYYILALQKCNSSGPHTIHGLWPQYSKYNWPSNCGGASFDPSQVSDLWGQLNTYWLSCPQDTKDTTEFLTHEWSKHGSCSGWDQHTYFNNGLQVYYAGNWQQYCSSYEDQCKVHVFLNQQDGKVKLIKKAGQH